MRTLTRTGLDDAELSEIQWGIREQIIDLARMRVRLKEYEGKIMELRGKSVSSGQFFADTNIGPLSKKCIKQEIGEVSDGRREG